MGLKTITMHESKNRHVEILDFLTITSELIEIDLLIQNEDPQTITSEGELKKYLQLKLRNNIFLHIYHWCHFHRNCLYFKTDRIFQIGKI